MTNEISLGWRIARDFNGDVLSTLELRVDGRSIRDYFLGQDLPSESTLGLPHGVSHRLHTLQMSELDGKRQAMHHDLIDWAGYSALTLNADGYPAGKIPLLTCCGDELCGYFACAMTLEGDTVVWREFGWVVVDWYHSGREIELEHFGFSPSSAQQEFRFEQTQYRSVIDDLLHSTWAEGPFQPIRRQARTYRVPWFAKARGLTFPNDVRFRVAEALTETDPLDFRRFGKVDPDVYGGLDSIFWDSQYKAFQRDPVKCVAEVLERNFGLPASREAVERACELALSSE